MKSEIKTIIDKLIKMRKYLMKISKSYRPTNMEREAIRQVEFYLKNPKTEQGWKEFASAKMDYIRVIAPTNKSGQSLLSKLNNLIQ